MEYHNSVPVYELEKKYRKLNVVIQCCVSSKKQDINKVVLIKVPNFQDYLLRYLDSLN